MICPEKVQDMCLFGMMCPREAIVDDDGECAAYIRQVLAMTGGADRAQDDPVEAAEVQREREAIQGEGALAPMWNEAPRLCKLLHWLGGASPSEVMRGCNLGCKRPSWCDCNRCPEFRGWREENVADV